MYFDRKYTLSEVFSFSDRREKNGSEPSLTGKWKLVQKKERLSNTSDRPTALLLLPLLFIILLPIMSGCELIGQTDVYYLDVKPASSVQGHISPVSREFEAGSEVTIQARPHTSWNWEFSHWEGDITGTDNPVTFTIDRDMKAVAHFQGQKLPLVIEIVGEGHVEHRVLGSSRSEERRVGKEWRAWSRTADEQKRRG